MMMKIHGENLAKTLFKELLTANTIYSVVGLNFIQFPFHSINTKELPPQPFTHFIPKFGKFTSTCE